MKIKNTPILILAIIHIVFIIAAKNPFITHMYTADPSAHVYEGRVYVYASHDRDNAEWFDMEDYHVFSSNDMKNWKDHGQVLHVKDVPWAREYMWAPDCAYKNGTYYFYFPARIQRDTSFQIGVATSKSPAGPFDPLPKAIEGSFSVDPAVFIDDDGQAYMYFGGDGHGLTKYPWVAKLKDNMVEFEGAPKKIEGLEYWFEACWMHKYKGKYYMSYSTGQNIPGSGSSRIGYAVGDNPLGPFTYKGVLNNEVEGWTNHHSIVEFRGNWYFFYHHSKRSNVFYKRSICVDYLYFNPDGTLKPIVMTDAGPDLVGIYSPFSNQSDLLGFNSNKTNTPEQVFDCRGRKLLPFVNVFKNTSAGFFIYKSITTQALAKLILH